LLSIACDTLMFSRLHHTIEMRARLLATNLSSNSNNISQSFVLNPNVKSTSKLSTQANAYLHLKANLSYQHNGYTMKGEIVSLPRLHEAEKNANHHVPTYSIQTRNASIPPRSTPLPPMLVRQALAPAHSAPTCANRTGATSAQALDASCRTMLRYWGPWAQGNEAEGSLMQMWLWSLCVCVAVMDLGYAGTRGNVGSRAPIIEAPRAQVYARKGQNATGTLCNKIPNIRRARPFPASFACALCFLWSLLPSYIARTHAHCIVSQCRFYRDARGTPYRVSLSLSLARPPHCKVEGCQPSSMGCCRWTRENGGRRWDSQA
jgi:hypothetical protein